MPENVPVTGTEAVEQSTAQAEPKVQPEVPKKATPVAEQITAPGKVAKPFDKPFYSFKESADYAVWQSNGIKTCIKCGSNKISDGLGKLRCPNDLADCEFIKG
jgi:hypothetical protein